MIKALATSADGKRKILVLGISELNVENLKKGHPIHIHGEEIGIPVDVFICYGKDEDAIRRDLLGDLISSETQVEDQRGKAKN